MSDLSDFFSCRDSPLLDAVLDQGSSRLCWAFALTSQFTAFLRFHNILKSNQRLSIQYLLNEVGQHLDNHPDWEGIAHGLGGVARVLVERGTVLESECPLTLDLSSRNAPGAQTYAPAEAIVHCRSMYGSVHDFENAMLDILRKSKSPIAVGLASCDTFYESDGLTAYSPNAVDYDFWVQSRCPYHVMLLTGRVLDRNRTPCFEFQNSHSAGCGDNGFLLLAQGTEMIIQFVELKLPEGLPISSSSSGSQGAQEHSNINEASGSQEPSNANEAEGLAPADMETADMETTDYAACLQRDLFFDQSFRFGVDVGGFDTSGDPDIYTTAKALKVLDACGSDIIELGVPCSDPLADGPVIQVLQRHIHLAQHLTTFTSKQSFLSKLDMEQTLVEAESYDICFEYIEEMIHKQEPLTNVLRLLVLFSVTNSGLPKKQFDYIRTELLHSYGFEHVIALNNLEKAGLLKKQEFKSNWQTVKRTLKLIVEDTDTSRPEDIAYVYSGYAPLSIRLIQQAIHSGWRPIEDILKLLPGPHLETKRSGFPSSPSVDSLHGASNGVADGRRSIVLVVFIGGVTFAEISALRYLASKEGMAYDLIIATTKIVNGATLIETFMEKLG